MHKEMDIKLAKEVLSVLGITQRRDGTNAEGESWQEGVPGVTVGYKWGEAELVVSNKLRPEDGQSVNKTILYGPNNKEYITKIDIAIAQAKRNLRLE